MKILILAPQPFYLERGTPIAVRATATLLGRAGHHVDLLVLHDGEDVAIDGVRVIRARRPPGIGTVPIGFSPAKLLCDAALSVSAWWLLARKRYDVVHAVEEAVFPALAARGFKRFKLIWDMDSLLVDQIVEKGGAPARLAPLLRPLERAAARKVDQVLAVCPAIVEAVRAMAPRQDVRVLPDIATPAPGGERPPAVADLRGGLASGDLLALYVGNLESYQGVDLLIEAMACLPRDSRCRLVIVGGGDVHIADARKHRDALGAGDRVRLNGRAPLDHLPHLLAQADILCSPRRHGVNTPMKIYSYMAAGRAILATDIVSHTQVLDSDTAALVPAEPQAMAAALLRLEHNDGLRQRLGDRARKRAETDFSQSAFDRRLLDAYSGLAAYE